MLNHKLGLFILIFILLQIIQGQDTMKYNQLTPEEQQIIIHKGTERPYTGEYYQHSEAGTYTCKCCDAPLFRSEDKFDAGCGWPSFDDAIPGAVKLSLDADGIRTEITCANCGAHLGHVFAGEGFTDKNTRHCVNSISMNFIPEPGKTATTQKAIFASGCFWGTEYHFKKIDGVLNTQVGFTGGHTNHPSYKQVCRGNTGHAEALQVTYDPDKVSYRDLTELFFETHNFSQENRQGPDIGEQYRSAIFYQNDEQKKIALDLIKELKHKGYEVATEVTPATDFWEAEEYHQDYYEKNNGAPYCHIYRQIF